MKFWHPRAISTAAVLCSATLVPAELHAGTSPMAVVLEYSAGPGCPEVDYFKAIVSERLGADAFADNAPTRVIVRVASRGQAFDGNMEWLDAKGNWAGDRTYPAHSSDCEDLVRAMAFTLVLQLQLSAVASAPPNASALAAESKPATVAQSSPPPPPAPDRRVVERREPAQQVNKPPTGHQAHPSLAVGAGTLLGFGMSSSVVPFARVFGSVAWPHFSLELATELSLPTTIRRSDGAGFSRQEVLASAAACGVLHVWSACLLAKAGEIRVTGRDIDVPASAAGPILETGLRASATQRVYRSAFVSAYAEGLVLPILWTVTLDQSVVWTSPRFAGTIGLDVAVRF